MAAELGMQLSSWVSRYLSWEEDLGRPLLLPLAPIDAIVNDVSASTGLPSDQIKIILCFVVTLAVGPLFRSVPRGPPRHIASLLVGLFFAQFTLGAAWIHSVVSSAICYALIVAAPTRPMPLLVFIVALFFMTVAHIHRMANPDSAVDYSSSQMILTMRLTSAAFEVADGRRITRERARAAAGETPKPVSAGRARIEADQARHALYSTPDPLTFFSFIMFFGSALVGPPFDLHEYTAATGRNAAPRPSPGARPYIKALLSLSFLVLYLVLREAFPSSRWLTEEFASAPIAAQIGFSWLILLGERMKYYFIWKITEAGCNACGFGYTRDEAGREGWEGVRNISVRGFELAQNLGEASKEWNSLTGAWLRTCVYERVPKATQMFAIYFVSAFWHGFYPGYYLFFMSTGLAQHVGKLVRQKCVGVEGEMMGVYAMLDVIL